MEDLALDREATKRVAYQVIQFAGVRLAVVEERLLQALCRRARVAPAPMPADAPPRSGSDEGQFDGRRLAQRLVQRRKRASLTQVELARRAGIRVETLNRIERGKTEPDFATIRKLVTAMNRVEANAEGAWPADSLEE
jgi:DNA-binding XRE family transcriptional regulator